MTWLSILIAGIVTYLSRMTMVTLIKREMLNNKIKEVLVYKFLFSFSSNNISWSFF